LFCYQTGVFLRVYLRVPKISTLKIYNGYQKSQNKTKSKHFWRKTSFQNSNFSELSANSYFCKIISFFSNENISMKTRFSKSRVLINSIFKKSSFDKLDFWKTRFLKNSIFEKLDFWKTRYFKNSIFQNENLSKVWKFWDIQINFANISKLFKNHSCFVQEF